MRAQDAKRQTASAHQQQCALLHSKRRISTPGNTSNPHHVAAGISTITAMSHTATSSVYPVYSSVLMQAEAPEAGHHISHAGRAEVQHLL